ncbi:MAG: hypothetical protein KKH94_08675, partial [Candidatus Omnitrophica bacterium]|nr:hypothetical protein [Candidatus Omnitrophota bacterium]
RKRRLEDYDWYLFWNVYSIGATDFWGNFRSKVKNIVRGEHYDNVYKEILEKKLTDNTVLFLSEPPSVVPRNYNKSLHENFRYIFTWKNSLVDAKKHHKFYIPVAENFKSIVNVPFSDRKLIADISGNKFSSHERELYTERRNTIKFFEQNYPYDFDLYGVGWDWSVKRYLWNGVRNGTWEKHRYKTYRGTVRDKLDVLPKYKFVICYENILDEDDYVSNRIFDVLRCGCVPIYWGAKNISDYVDEDAFIDRRDFKSNEALAEHICSISEKEYEKFLCAGRAYINGEKFKLFLSDNFSDTIIKVLRLNS